MAKNSSIHSAISTEFRLVTDKQTPGHSIYTALHTRRAAKASSQLVRWRQLPCVCHPWRATERENCRSRVRACNTTRYQPTRAVSHTFIHNRLNVRPHRMRCVAACCVVFAARQYTATHRSRCDEPSAGRAPQRHIYICVAPFDTNLTAFIFHLT